MLSFYCQMRKLSLVKSCRTRKFFISQSCRRQKVFFGKRCSRQKFWANARYSRTSRTFSIKFWKFKDFKDIKTTKIIFSRTIFIFSVIQGLQGHFKDNFSFQGQFKDFKDFKDEWPPWRGKKLCWHCSEGLLGAYSLKSKLDVFWNIPWKGYK